jgi:hypothetical protein
MVILEILAGVIISLLLLLASVLITLFDGVRALAHLIF